MSSPFYQKGLSWQGQGGSDYETGLEKMEEIVSTCESLQDVEVVIDSSITYIVRICAFTSGVIYLGYEWRTGRRCVFSLNLLITVVRIL